MTRLLTTREVSDLLSVDVETIRRFVRLGQIRAVPLGRLVRIPADEIDRITRDGLGEFRRSDRSAQPPGPGTKP